MQIESMRVISHRSWRVDEVSGADARAALAAGEARNRALDTYQQHYCHHRPHGGKKQNFRTPMAYYQHLKEAA